MFNQFTNKYLKNLDILKQAKVGFEFEFYSKQSYFKLIEKLNNKLSPIKVLVSEEYHSDIEVDSNTFKLEPDFSGGPDMVELITGKMDYLESKIILNKILYFLQEHAVTDDLCSIHLNVSFDNQKITNDTILKLILNIDETYILKNFKNRVNNIYSKSIKSLLPLNVMSKLENIYSNSFMFGDEAKYYGINFLKKDNDYLEFRYIGGEDYQFKVDDINEIFDYYIILMYESMHSKINEEDILKLNILIDRYKDINSKFLSYRDYLGNFETTIEVDMDQSYESVQLHWNKIKDRILNIHRFSIIDGGKINYNSQLDSIEIVDAKLSNIIYLSDYTFIDCIIFNSTIGNSTIVNCDLDNCHIHFSSIHNTKIVNSKISGSKLDRTQLDKVNLDTSSIKNSNFNSGTFRSGKILENVNISDNVRMVVNSKFWLNLPVGIGKKGKKKGIIKK